MTNPIKKVPLKKLVGLKKVDFDQFVESGQIKVRPARLIPALKTGDEMALSSIFITSLKLVKEYRDSFFKQIKLSRSGKVYYYTEAEFEGHDGNEIDGLIIVVIKGVITDAAFLEMKSKNSPIEQDQIERYCAVANDLGVCKMITISNEFVADPSHSPVNIRTKKKLVLYHFSWTFLVTMGQLLLFKNDTNIADEDQVEIMREVLFYFEHPQSGINGYTQMKKGWKDLSEAIYGQTALKGSESIVHDSVLSWYEEEKDIALLLSRKLGVLVKSTPRTKDSIKADIKRLVNENYISSVISIRNAASDIKVIAEFERRAVSMQIKLTPPMNKGNGAKITWLSKQLEKAKNKSEKSFQKLENKIWIEVNIKFAKDNIKLKLADFNDLQELTNGKEIQGFYISVIDGFGKNFGSVKKFVELIEQLILDYYESIVQHMSNWVKPAPKLMEAEV